MTVTLPTAQARGSVFEVKAVYKTSSTATALGWLSKEQTADKKQPYVFSQCQAIHARSLVLYVCASGLCVGWTLA